MFLNTQIAPEFIKCECTITICAVHHKCCFLPTEIHAAPDGSVSVLFVGQGGGRDERKKGRPFIGPSGKRLRHLILYVRKKLGRHIGVAFSNTIRDNPDANRVPSHIELQTCMPFLYKDIATLMKKGLQVIVPLGKAAIQALVTGHVISVSEYRGRVLKAHDPLFGEIDMVPTFHPSFLYSKEPVFDYTKPSELDLIMIADIIKACELQNTEKDIQIEVDP